MSYTDKVSSSDQNKNMDKCQDKCQASFDHLFDQIGMLPKSEQVQQLEKLMQRLQIEQQVLKFVKKCETKPNYRLIKRRRSSLSSEDMITNVNYFRSRAGTPPVCETPSDTPRRLGWGLWDEIGRAHV